jgi:hypothetical protein
MKRLKKIKCYLFGHRFYEPTQGVEGCLRCDDHRAPHLDGGEYWSNSEAYGRIGWLWLRLKASISSKLTRPVPQPESDDDIPF